MKKIFLATAVLIASSFIVTNAADISRKTDRNSRRQLRKERKEKRRELWLHSVNPVTASHFYGDFPNAENVSWTEGAFAEATFYDGDILKTAYYDTDDELVGTTTDVDFSILPERAKYYINKKYPDYTVQKIILFDDNESNDTDMFLFSNSFDDEDTYFAVLSDGAKKIILKVATDGDVSFFHDYK